jgi:hypothetical protein
MEKRTLVYMTALALSSMVFGKGVAVESVKQDSLPNSYDYHNRMVVFYPFHQAYERIKPDDFYFGVEGWVTYVLCNDRSHSNGTLGEAELRLGYNYLYNGRDHVTPFVGGGVIKDYSREWIETRHRVGGIVVGRKVYSYHKPAVIYGVFGFLYDHEFNSIFNLGANVKGLIGGSGERRWNWGSVVGGLDVSLPITFRFGRDRHWDIRLEPFYIYLGGSRISRQYFGGRSTVGYRF